MSSSTSSSSTSTTITTSSVFFRNNVDHEDDYNDIPQLSQPSSLQQQQPSSLPSLPSLPTWLSIPKGHLAQSNLQELSQTMKASHLFTEIETRKLLHAIHVAAKGDPQLVAGAAEFSSILVQMEMSYSALVAAAFHYTCCVQKARQRQQQQSQHQQQQQSHHQDDDGDRLDPLDMLEFGSVPVSVPTEQLQLFDQHAVSIAQDAARLKQLELLAATVVTTTTTTTTTSTSNNNIHNNIRRPDTKDAENLRKLLLSESSDWRGLAIRCAASLYRLRGLEQAATTATTTPTTTTATTTVRPKLSPETIRAAREALLIYAPLASRLGMRWLKNELENTAFKLLYRRQYQRVQSYELYSSMEQVLNNIQSEMSDMLAHDDEFSSLVRDVSVTARVKEPYSIWNKMLRHKYQHVLQVPDALALRIVLNAKKLTDEEPDPITVARERALCYYAQKLCLQRWKPSAQQPRFKDYIEHPKANGYQSLHYTAQNEHDWTLEIQVRTGQMHQIAEFGLASHWDYKAQQKNGPASSSCSSSSSTAANNKEDQSSDAYLRKVQEWRWQQQAQKQQQRHPQANDSSSSSKPITLSDIWQSKVREDRIRDRAQRLEPYLTALTEAQSDLARQFVFVFLSSSNDHPHPRTTNNNHKFHNGGRVLALPSGSCVLDALREGEKAVGCPLVFRTRPQDLVVNGAMTKVTRQLNNGDVLSLPLLSCL